MYEYPYIVSHVHVENIKKKKKIKKSVKQSLVKALII